MQPAPQESLGELQRILGRMPLQVCCVAALPELGVRWREVARAVRNHRLPMTAPSVAKVLRQHAAKTLPAEHINEVLAKLRLMSVITQHRAWHAITLLEPAAEPGGGARSLAARVLRHLGRARLAKNKQPQVLAVNMGDLVYLSVQMVSETRRGPPLYVAAAPGEPVAFASTLAASGLLKTVVEGLGYARYEDARLFGPDVAALLRVADRRRDETVGRLAAAPPYRPAPALTALTAAGVDYTTKVYDEEYVDALLGPQPALLTGLKVTTTKPFFDHSRLNRLMTVKVEVRSGDIARTLRNWVKKGALKPQSELFTIFVQMKSNDLVYQEGQEA